MSGGRGHKGDHPAPSRNQPTLCVARTRERNKIIWRMLAERKSYDEIAAELRVTRSLVAGVAYRRAHGRNSY